MADCEYLKPIIVRLIQKIGKPIDGARVQVDAPKIQGFLAIESQDVSGATQYIAIDNIASFTVIDEEAVNVCDSFPMLKIEVRQR